MTMTDNMNKEETLDPNAPDKPLVAPEDKGEENKEGNTSESEDESSSEDEADKKSDPVKDLRRKITEQGEQLAGYQDLIQIASQHPGWTFKDIISYVQSGREPDKNSDADKDPFEDLYEPLIGKDEGGKKALVEFANRVATRVEKSLMGKIQPFMAKTVESDVTSRYEKGLRQSGLDSEDLDSEDFNQFAAEYKQENRSWLTAVEKADPVKAGQFVGEAYAKKLGKSGSMKANKDRIALKKDSMLEKTGSRGLETKDKANTVVLPRNASMQTIHQYIRAGKKVSFKD